MKNLLYNCLTGVFELTDAFTGENLASQLVIDYTGTECETWTKWLDVKKPNGQTGNVSLGTNAIVYQPIPSEWTERGRLEINPYAIGLLGEVQRFPIKHIPMKEALLVAQNTIDYEDSAFVVLQNLVASLELSKVDKVTGKSLIADTEIARLLTLANYDDTALAQDITDLGIAKMDTDGLNSNVKHMKFDTTDAVELVNVGEMHWSPTDRTIELKMTENVDLSVGEEQVTDVRNVSGAGMLKGQAVYVNGSTGNQQTVLIASNDNPAVCGCSVGVLLEGISNNGVGFMSLGGVVRGLNTSGLTEGSPIYLGLNGALTMTLPTKPAVIIRIGTVTRVHASLGSILVAIITLPPLQNLSNVQVSSVADKEVLRFNSATNRWENKNLDDTYYTETETNALLLNKVSVAEGKGLSDENYTLAEKNKVDNIPANTISELGGKAPTDHDHLKADITDFAHTHVKADVGLGNVDNTTDLLKPISNAQATVNATKVDKLMATNLVTNGDFSNGTTGWKITTGSNISVDTNELLVNYNALSHSLELSPIISVNTNDIMYYSFYIKGNGEVLRLRADSTTFTDDIATTTSFVRKSYRQTSANTTVYLKFILLTAPSLPTSTKLDNVLAINLTTLFGAGKEPSALEMDNLLANFPNSWFNGTQELINYKELYLDLTEKANKTQEAWITATLLNGATGSITYAKNSMGFVTIKVNIVVNTSAYNTIQATLPTGYFPSVEAPIILRNYTIGGVTAQFTVDTSGSIRVLGGVSNGQGVRGIFTFYVN